MRAMIAAMAVLVMTGCMTPNPRGVLMRQDNDGGAIALYAEDDIEPSEHIARRDALEQMDNHCGYRGYTIVSEEKVDSGNTVAVNYGYGVSVAKRVLVTQLTYRCGKH